LVTGWGITNSSTGTVETPKSYEPSNQAIFLGESADILQKVGLPIMDKNACVKAYSSLKVTLSKHQICAGGMDNKDSCGGDSGGPMMVPTLRSDGEAVYIQYVYVTS